MSVTVAPATSTYDPNPEHELLRETVRDFFRQELPHERIRELEEQRLPVPRDVWKKMGELGWLGLTLPEQYGGDGASLVTAIVMQEEIDRG